MTNKLELILGKGLQEEFLFDLGQLSYIINKEGLDSPQVIDFKHLIQEKYRISKKNIKGNYMIFQSYIYQMGDKK